MNRTTRLAAIYARISTDKQNPLSPADQERKCREYADRNSITVLDAHVYVDEGLSSVGMDRPSLQQMLRAALSPAKPFDVILVDDTSRLSRSTESVLSIYRKLNFAGLQLISVSQGIDSRQDQAETLLTIHGLIDSSYVNYALFLLSSLAPILAGFSHCARGFYDARNASTAGPRRGKRTSRETHDCLSHDSGRWTLYLL